MSLFALAAEPRVEFIQGKEAIHKEYCRSYSPENKRDCDEPVSRSVILIYLPAPLAKTVAAQIGHAYKQGFFEDFSVTDFYHGHLIFRGPQVEYANPDELFQNFSAILYHSAETNQRWQKERERGLEPKACTQRSFVGQSGEQVQKAIELMKPGQALKNFDKGGTIYTEELVEAKPNLSSHKFKDYGAHEKLHVTACLKSECRRCEVQSMMLAVVEAGGRFTGPKGERYELYLRCLSPI